MPEERKWEVIRYETYRDRGPFHGQEIWYEEWECTTGQRERHYFIKGTDTYVLGFNPEFLPVEQAEDILKTLGYKITGERRKEGL